MVRIRDEVLAIATADATGMPAAGDGADDAADGASAVPLGNPDDTTSADETSAAVGTGSPAGTELPAGASGADVPEWVRSILRCPDCGGELRDVERALQCTSCAHVHPVEGGIPVLIEGRNQAPTPS